MATATLARQVARMREALAVRRTAMATTAPLLERLRQDPARLMALAGMQPDPWQSNLLRSQSLRTLLLCSRQSGKSTSSSALALREALSRPRSLVLLLSPTLRQSGELFRDKLLRLYHTLGDPVPAVRLTATELELANGSRVVSLPENESGIRGFSGVRLLIVDEASRVSDDLYRAVRPMLATSGGALVALSTPFGKRGWFFEEWESRHKWERVRITAEECPRISREFLAEEREALGERWYAQEYLCDFTDLIGAVFSHADIQRALSDDVLPLFPA